MPVNDFETYKQKEANLQNPELIAKAGPDNVARLKRDMRAFRVNNPQHFSGVQEEGLPKSLVSGLNESALVNQEAEGQAKAKSQANRAGYDIDLTRPDVIQNLADDPKRTELIARVREATRDSSLPNASGLKMFNDPPDYVPPKPKLSLTNPLAFLPTAAQRHYFYEPSVEEFRGAMTDGSIARRMKKEFGLADDVSRLSDQDIENSTTFKAFQDASWKHALADAMRDGYAISRVAKSKEMGGVDAAQAKALDPAMSGANGLLAGMTGGLSRPTETEEERRSASRNPGMSLGGEVIGTFTPTGLPARLATGSAKLLGKAGLASKGVQGVVKGIGAAGLAGAADAGLRDVAKFTADALDAADSAEESAQRFYEMAQGLPGRMAQGAGLGAAFGAGGEALGGLASAGARALVGGKPREMLLRAANSGLKMKGTGGPKVPDDLIALSDEAAMRGHTPERELAEGVADRLATQRLLEQEGMHRNALDDTAQARERLVEPVTAGPPSPASPLDVMPRPTKEQLEAHKKAVSSVVGITPEEGQAVHRFTHGYDESLRAMQRGSTDAEVAAKHPRGAEHAAEARASIGPLKSYMDKMPKATEVPYVYRGIVVPESELQKLLTQDSIIADPVGRAAVTSASADPVVARSFVARNLNDGQRGVVLKLKHQSAVGTGQYASQRMQVEKELLVPGDAEFRVVKRYEDSSNPGQFIIEAEEVAKGSAAPTKKATVRTADAADRIDELRRGMSDIVGDVNRNELRSIASRLRQRGSVTAEQIDADIDALERRAKSGAKDPDPNILAVKKVMLDLRDELKSADDATSVDNFAIRDQEGNVKPVGGYSALKARQAREKTAYEVENSAMGLPTKLKAEAENIGRAPTEMDIAALAEGVTPKVKFRPHEREAFVGRIAESGAPDNAVRFEQYRDLAARAGLGDGEKLAKLRQLRSTKEWRQYLGQAISGIGTGGGSFIRSAQLLRAAPTLNSLSGGLPRMEATDKAVDVIDRFLAQTVPSWKSLHLRGGQAARPAGALANDSKGKPRDTLTDEEAEFAAKVIRSLNILEKQ